MSNNIKYGSMPINPALITIFNPIDPFENVMITEDDSYMGTEDDFIMETQES
jgi:hypothetical protein